MLPDRVIENVDVVLRTLFAPAQTVRPYPDQDVAEAEMSDSEREHALGLMRVNHVGEVCAHALDHGHSFTAPAASNSAAFHHATQAEG